MTLIRGVSRSECPWLKRDYKAGQVVYLFHGATYGCIGPNGIAVSEEPGIPPFFEMPDDALIIRRSHVTESLIADRSGTDLGQAADFLLGCTVQAGASRGYRDTATSARDAVLAAQSALDKLQEEVAHQERVIASLNRRFSKQFEAPAEPVAYVRPDAVEAMAASSQQIRQPEQRAAEYVRLERQRQLEVEGWSAEHDDQHTEGEMLRAAVIYTWHGTTKWGYEGDVPKGWPWDPQWWKPKSRQRNLERAGALCLAEGERLLRAGLPTEPANHKYRIVIRELTALLATSAVEGGGDGEVADLVERLTTKRSSLHGDWLDAMEEAAAALSTHHSELAKLREEVARLRTTPVVTEDMVEAGLRAAEIEAANFIFGGEISFHDGFSEAFKARFRAIHRAALTAALTPAPSDE